MNKVWNIVSVLAVANMLALGAFAAWLSATDRMSVDRLREVRALLVTTLADEAAEKDAQAAKEAEEAAQAERERAESRPPLTAAERLAARVEATELDRQRAERLKREVADLQRALAAERSQIDSARARLAADRKTFDDAIAMQQAAREDEQFQKTLAIIVSLKPDQAVAMLLPGPAAGEPAFLDPAAQGSPAAGRNLDHAVRYLDAMDDKARSRIIAQVLKTDSRLAAELLERLRTHGLVARGP